MQKLVFFHVFYLESISFRIHHLTNNAGSVFHNVSPCLFLSFLAAGIIDFMAVNCWAIFINEKKASLAG